MEAPFGISERTKTAVFVCLGLGLLLLFCYQAVAGHRFVEFDDGIYTFQNLHVIRGLSWQSVEWAFTNTDVANWHPVTWVELLAERELFGPHAGAYLMMNVGYHWIAACLCFLGFRRFLKNDLYAFFIAAVFALHPANVENVAWLSERKSILNAICWFGAIIAYHRYLESKRWRWYGMIMVLHLLGLMCKAMSVTLPCTLMLLYFLNADLTGGLKRFSHVLLGLLWNLAPLFLISVYFSAVTLGAQEMAMSSLDMISLGGRLVNSLSAYVSYLKMFFWPDEFAIFYPLFVSELTPEKGLVAGLALSAVTAVVLWLTKQNRLFLIGWLWFLGTLVPVIGLVQVGSQAYADRYLYIPMLGLCLWIVGLFELVGEKFWLKKPAVVGVYALLYGVVLGCHTWVQVGYWENGFTLFRHSISVTGDCITSVKCVASSYFRSGLFAEGDAFLKQKLSISKNPSSKAQLLTLRAQGALGLNDLGTALTFANDSIALGSNDMVNYWIQAEYYLSKSEYPKSRAALIEARKRQPGRNNVFAGDFYLGTRLNLLETELSQKEAEAKPKGS